MAVRHAEPAEEPAGRGTASSRAASRAASAASSRASSNFPDVSMMDLGVVDNADWKVAERAARKASFTQFDHTMVRNYAAEILQAREERYTSRNQQQHARAEPKPSRTDSETQLRRRERRAAAQPGQQLLAPFCEAESPNVLW